MACHRCSVSMRSRLVALIAHGKKNTESSHVPGGPWVKGRTRVTGAKGAGLPSKRYAKLCHDGEWDGK